VRVVAADGTIVDGAASGGALATTGTELPIGTIGTGVLLLLLGGVLVAMRARRRAA
jgi:hypothetical protein